VIDTRNNLNFDDLIHVGVGDIINDCFGGEINVLLMKK
jgi:hypothetical protein